MNAKHIAMHEVDEGRLHWVREGHAEYVAALGAEFADMGPVRGPNDLLSFRSHAFRIAVAMLGVYRSRVDFLRHRALDTDAEGLRYRFTALPALTGPAPEVTH